MLQHFRLWAESSADKTGEVLLEQEKGYDSVMQEEFKFKAEIYSSLSFLKQRGGNCMVLIVQHISAIFIASGSSYLNYV